MREHAIQPRRQPHLADFGPDDSGAYHPRDPRVARACDIEDGVLVAEEDVVNLRPHSIWQHILHHGDHFVIALQAASRRPNLPDRVPARQRRST